MKLEMDRSRRKLFSRCIATHVVMCLAMFLAFALIPSPVAYSQAKQEIAWSPNEKPIAEQIHGLRALPDDVRATTTKDLALKIRNLPATENKLRLAVGLAGLSTEGDFGHATLQEVATTLAETLRERPLPWTETTPEPTSQAKAGASSKSALAKREPAYPYVELATLVRYEHIELLTEFTNDDGQFHAAMVQLETDDRKREHPEFSLKDLSGKTWTFSDLRGKVVLVNFCATWCPPCRKEMPDLETLYRHFEARGFAVLGISDEEAAKVGPFISERKVTFPVLLDPGRKVNDLFMVEGIPRSFVYGRDGKLVTQSIDMRTQKQFLEMLSKAGLQ
jgi:peroxiredoxin